MNKTNSEGCRIENDSLGEVKVPVNALYQAQTQRAIENFSISGRQIPPSIIDALLDIKSCAAAINGELKQISKADSHAVQAAVKKAKLLDFSSAFPIDVFQTGSGTSTHMNVNEVVATIASEISQHTIHPNDTVNRGQSSNDVFPSAIQMAVVRETQNELMPALENLQAQLAELAEKNKSKVKNGRTHLMDATPISFGQEFTCWAMQVAQTCARIRSSIIELTSLPIGGTAVGNGINCHPDFAQGVCRLLEKIDGVSWQAEATPAVKMSAQDHHLHFAAGLKNVAVVLIKIANDLRWMNSGPVSGLGEVQLPALQPGSSIMPGKINPVIAEAVMMAATEVIGNETTITIAAQSGNFQLNVMLPLIGDKLIQSVTLLTGAVKSLSHQALNALVICDQHTTELVALNPILATALNQEIGYDLASKIAKRSASEKIPVLEIALEETDLTRDKLSELLKPLTMLGQRFEP